MGGNSWLVARGSNPTSLKNFAVTNPASITTPRHEICVCLRHLRITKKGAIHRTYTLFAFFEYFVSLCGLAPWRDKNE